MNKALIELINKAKAVKSTNDALIESFERYIHLLMQHEIDYEYIKIDDFKKTLKHNSWRMALYESRLNSLTEEENFNHFCRYIHLQIEGLLNYYLSLKYSSCDEFKMAYSDKIKNRLNELCQFNYDNFKREYDLYLNSNKTNDNELDDDGQEEVVAEEWVDNPTDFIIKYKQSLELFLKNKYELKVFVSPDEERRIKTDLDFSIISSGIKSIEDKYTEVSRIPFAYKFEYFALSYDIDNAYKIGVDALTDYRNKELSHSGELTLSLTRNAKALKEKKNFMALKDCLQEINQLVKLNS